MAKKQAAKPAESVTPENVDDMTDEQVTEFMQSMQDEAPEEEAASQEPEKQPEKAETEPEKAVEAAEVKDQEQPEETGDETDEKEPEKAETVDFKRYDYERNRRRDAEKARDADRAEWQRRFDELLKTVQKPESKEDDKPAIPNEEEDPVATIRWLKEQLVASQQQREQETAEERQNREVWEQQQALLNEAGSEFQQAVAADPTVKDAYDALVQSFRNEAQMYRVPPHELKGWLDQTEMQHVLYAKQNHIPIDNYIKGLAQARGWQAKSAEAPKQELKDTTEAQRKAKTLSNGGGSPGVSDSLSAEDILAMPDKEFDAFIAKHGSVSAYLENAS